MKRCSALLGVALAIALYGGRAAGCPCQGSSGPGAALTTSAERLGASLTETARVAHGVFRPDGTYSALGDGSSQWAIDLTALVAARLVPPLELGVEASFGRGAFVAPGDASDRTGFGDTVARARFEAFDEPMPFEATVLPWPSVALIGAVRMPTAVRGDPSTSSGTTGSVGASGSSEGLGAVESSLAVALARRVSTSWQVSFVGEGAYRFADRYLDLERQLGPRLFAQLGARYAFSPEVGVGVLADLGWEGDVAYQGTTRADTAQRSLAGSLYGYVGTRYSPLRWGAILRHVPGIDGLGVNAVAATSLAVSLGYSIE